MRRPVAVILAGGEGSRLGGAVKATIEIGGRRLLDRVADALRPSAERILVAHGRIDLHRLSLAPDLIGVPDLDSDQRGPIAGLAAALAWLASHHPRTEFLVSAAVDTPFFPANFVPQALELAAASGAAAVVVRYDGQDYPTNALWRVAALNDLPLKLLAGTAPRSLKRLVEELAGRPLDWPMQPDGDPFSNVNTPSDLAVLARRVRS